MAIIAGPEGSIQRGGPLAVIQPQYIPTSTPGSDGGVGFQEILNKAFGKARSAGTKGLEAATMAVGLPGVGSALPIGYGLSSLMQGDIARGAGEIGGGLAGARLAAGPAAAAQAAVSAMGPRGKLLAPLVGGAVRIAGGLLGGGVGGGVSSAVGGGLANAAQAATGGAAQTQMGRGESPGLIPGVGGKGIGYSADDIAKIEQLSKITGRSQVDIAREMLPISNQYRDAEMQRQMQLNQQTGQLTGALNRQLYTAQLAQGAQSQAGETTRTMLTAANPYASSAFQYRG